MRMAVITNAGQRLELHVAEDLRRLASGPTVSNGAQNALIEGIQVTDLATDRA